MWYGVNMDELFWKYDNNLRAYIIYYDKPWPKPYVGETMEIRRLTMESDRFNEVTVDEIVQALNYFRNKK